jgi:hypothetical protein
VVLFIILVIFVFNASSTYSLLLSIFAALARVTMKISASLIARTVGGSGFQGSLTGSAGPTADQSQSPSEAAK